MREKNVQLRANPLWTNPDRFHHPLVQLTVIAHALKDRCFRMAYPSHQSIDPMGFMGSAFVLELRPLAVSTFKEKSLFSSIDDWF